MSPSHAPDDLFNSQPRLLCLHSSASSGRQWDALLPALSTRHEVIAPPLLGYADSRRWPAGRSVSLDQEAQALEPLLGEHGAHLFGHSYGGAVAMQLALRRPDRVLSLTLYEPVRFALLVSPGPSEAIRDVAQRVALEVLSGDLFAAAAFFVDYWSGEGSWQQMSLRRREALAERMPKVKAEFEALFADPVPAAAWRTLKMPLRLLGGSRSPQTTLQVLDRLVQLWPQARRRTVHGLGHMGPVEAPLQVLAATDFDPALYERTVALAA